MVAMMLVLAITLSSLFYLWGVFRSDNTHDKEIYASGIILEELRIGEFEHSIIVNGVSLNDVSFHSPNEYAIYTHVHLLPILAALEIDSYIEVDEQGRNQIVFENFNSDTITITQDSNAFLIDGVPININGLSAVVVNGRLYVPIQFFEDIFDFINAYFSEGTIFINDVRNEI